MVEAVTTGLTTVIGWVGTVITSITGESGQLAELLPLFAVGISISAVLLGEFAPSLNRSISVKPKLYSMVIPR